MPLLRGAHQDMLGLHFVEGFDSFDGFIAQRAGRVRFDDILQFAHRFAGPVLQLQECCKTQAMQRIKRRNLQ